MSALAGPRARHRVRDGARLALAPPVLLGLGVIVAAILLTRAGDRSALFQDDDALYVNVAQYIAHHGFGALFEWGVYQRGLQRLNIWLMAPGFAMGGSPGAFQWAHAVQAIAYASTAIPVYLLARGLGLRRWWPLVPAFLALLVPWAVVSTSFLTEPVAYAAYAWFLYLAWLALVEPRPRNDVLALVGFALTPLSRTGFVVLAPVLPLAAVIFAFSRAGSWRAGPRELWRTHKVLVVVTVLAAVAIALRAATAGGWSSLTGSYGAPPLSNKNLILTKDLTGLARVMAGTGYLPMIFALPWLLAGLVRRGDGPRQAFSLIAVLSAGAILVQLAGAAPDERYIMYLGIPVFLAAAASIVRREVWLPGVAIAAVACGALFLGESWVEHGGAFAFFAFPTEAVYQRVLTGRLTTGPLSHLPGGTDAGVVILVAAWLIASLAALRVRRWGIWAVAGVLGAIVVVQAVQTRYVMSTFGREVANENGPSLSQRAFIDRMLPDGESAGIYSGGPGNQTAFRPIWSEAQFWNTKLRYLVRFTDFTGAPARMTDPLSSYAHVDPDTGKVTLTEGPLPRILLVPRAVMPIRLAWKELPPGYLPLDTVELERPARALWRIDGMQEDGWLLPHSPAQIRIFKGAGRADQCADMQVAAPPGNFKGSSRYAISGPWGLKHGALRANERKLWHMPLHFHGKPYVQYIIDGSRGLPLGDGRNASAMVSALFIGKCTGNG